MVAGLLMPDVSDPLSLAAQTSEQMAQQPPQPQPQGQPQMTQAGYMRAPMPSMPGQQQQPYMTPGNLNEIYGLLAANADNPQQVGMDYVRAMQSQQQADFSQSPVEQWLRLYGNINPYDFTAESLAAFHDTMMQTGDMAQAFRKLERVEDLSTKEQGYLNDAIKKAQTAEVSLGRMSNLADRFINMAPQMRSGVAGRMSDWMAGIIGSESDVEALRTEYEQFKNKLVVEGLPPGVASDTDIAIAMRGWPPSTANPPYVAAFLRGAAKLEAIKYAQAQHEAAFLSRNRTQQGQLEEWQQLRDVRSMDALRRLGGISAPKRADGSPMTPEEAAAFMYGGSPSVGGQQPTNPAAATGQALGDAKRDFETIYKQYSRE